MNAGYSRRYFNTPSSPSSSRPRASGHTYDPDVCSIKRVERLDAEFDSIPPPRRDDAPAIKYRVKFEASAWRLPAAVDDALCGDSGRQQRLVEIVPDAS